MNAPAIQTKQRDLMPWVLFGSLGVILAGMITWLVVASYEPTELWVVNGLSVPVIVAVGDQRVPLGSNSWKAIKPGGGEHAVVVTSGERELSRETIDIDSGAEIAIYNVLGAAFVAGENVWYGGKGEQRFEIYAYETFFQIHEEVHLRFRAPPSSANTSSGAAYYRWVGVGTTGPFWHRTLSEAPTRVGAEKAAAFEAALRQAMPGEFHAAR